MKDDFKSLPLGVYDTLTKEGKSRKALLSRIEGEFEKWGYALVETPILENYENFAQGVGAIERRKMFKISDTNGELLVLRPDMTLPVMRVAVKQGEFPKKLYYSGKIFSLTSEKREIVQSGVEFLGASEEADLEVIALAIESMKKATEKDFFLEIGNVAFFNAIMKEYGVLEEDLEEIRLLVNSKNGFEVSLKFEENEKLKKLLETLPTLFGGREVFEKAKNLSKGDASKKVLESLESLYDSISSFCPSVTVDLGLLPSITYYTGVVFKVYASGSHREIITGGRYDTLSQNFGKEIPAIGFAMDVKELTKIFSSEENSLLKVLVKTKSLESKLLSDLENELESLGISANSYSFDICYGNSLEENYDYIFENGTLEKRGD